MLDPQSVRDLTPAQRRRLLNELVRLEAERADTGLGSRWRWDVALIVIVLCCLGLAAWIGILAVTLPGYYRIGTWRGAWVGFDIGLLLAFAATGWAAWKRRQLLVVSLAVLATLLVCDAWFDVVLDARSSNVWFSLASALIVELPLAVLAALTARRLLRLSIARIMLYEGLPGRVPPLWRVPLLGPDPAPLRRLFAVQGTAVTGGAASPAEPGAAAAQELRATAGRDREGRADVGMQEDESGVA